MIESPAKATFVITDEGKRVLRDGPEVIDRLYLMKYGLFRKFQSRNKADDAAINSQGQKKNRRANA